MEIVLVMLNTFQEYILDAIQCLRKFNNHKIVVLTDCVMINIFQERNIKVVAVEGFMPSYKEYKAGLTNTFRDGFWQLALYRFKILQTYMQHHKKQSIVHIENDILVYKNLSELNLSGSNKILLTMDSKTRCIPGIMYIPNVETLQTCLDHFKDNLNDMENWGLCYKELPHLVDTLPIFPLDTSSQELTDITKNYPQFNCIFDAAAIGQYVGGVDPRNAKGDTSGFVNETCLVNYSKYNIIWKTDTTSNILAPFLQVNSIDVPIVNLHIHCKDLKKFINYDITTTWYKFEVDVYDTFFHKQTSKTQHESLGNVNGTLIPGFLKTQEDGDVFFTHINYYTIKEALRQLLIHNKDLNKFKIVETGCSVHGVKSTLLWDKFVNFYDGSVVSVILNEDAVNDANGLISSKSKIINANSFDYLPKIDTLIDFLYLDNINVDFLNPLQSAMHHLEEFNRVKHLLHKNSIVLIDDTPVSPEWLDDGQNNPIYSTLRRQFNPKIAGKGSLVNLELEKMGATKILHQYQTLWRL
jgi:hypothetical protein